MSKQRDEEQEVQAEALDALMQRLRDVERGKDRSTSGNWAHEVRKYDDDERRRR